MGRVLFITILLLTSVMPLSCKKRGEKSLQVAQKAARLAAPVPDVSPALEDDTVRNDLFLTKGSDLQLKNMSLAREAICRDEYLRLTVEKDPFADYVEYSVCPSDCTPGDEITGEFSMNTKTLYRIPYGASQLKARSCVRSYNAEDPSQRCGEWVTQQFNLQPARNLNVQGLLLARENKEKEIQQKCWDLRKLMGDYAKSATEFTVLQPLIVEQLLSGVDFCTQFILSGGLVAKEALPSEEEENPDEQGEEGETEGLELAGGTSESSDRSPLLGTGIALLILGGLMIPASLFFTVGASGKLQMLRAELETKVFEFYIPGEGKFGANRQTLIKDIEESKAKIKELEEKIQFHKDNIAEIKEDSDLRLKWAREEIAALMEEGVELQRKIGPLENAISMQEKTVKRLDAELEDLGTVRRQLRAETLDIETKLIVAGAKWKKKRVIGVGDASSKEIEKMLNGAETPELKKVRDGYQQIFGLVEARIRRRLEGLERSEVGASPKGVNEKKKYGDMLATLSGKGFTKAKIDVLMAEKDFIKTSEGYDKVKRSLDGLRTDLQGDNLAKQFGLFEKLEAEGVSTRQLERLSEEQRIIADAISKKAAISVDTEDFVRDLRSELDPLTRQFEDIGKKGDLAVRSAAFRQTAIEEGFGKQPGALPAQQEKIAGLEKELATETKGRTVMEETYRVNVAEPEGQFKKFAGAGALGGLLGMMVLSAGIATVGASANLVSMTEEDFLKQLDKMHTEIIQILSEIDSLSTEILKCQ